jgi:hypothetical protein
MHGRYKLKPDLWSGNKLRRDKLRKEEFKSSGLKSSLMTIRRKKDFFLKMKKEIMSLHQNSKRIKKNS